MISTVFYAYPIDLFERNADTKDIITAYESDVNNSREFPVLKLTPDELAEKINDEMFNDQEYWIRAVKEEDLSKNQLAEQLREEIIQEIICQEGRNRQSYFQRMHGRLCKYHLVRQARLPMLVKNHWDKDRRYRSNDSLRR